MRMAFVSAIATVLGWLHGRRVDFVKIDAQGYDMHVAMSAGDLMSRIDAFELEMTMDSGGLAVAGFVPCSHVLGNMTLKGFQTLHSKSECNGRGHGAGWLFRKAALS